MGIKETYYLFCSVFRKNYYMVYVNGNNVYFVKLPTYLTPYSFNSYSRLVDYHSIEDYKKGYTDETLLASGTFEEVKSAYGLITL